MSAPIDFYFDFSSPYGYVASELIEALAAKHGRTVLWHPMLLGVAFKAIGTAPLPSIPLKGPYSLRDIGRTARFFGVPYKHPNPFPIPTQLAARAFLWISDRDLNRAKAFARDTYRAYFTEGRNIADQEQVLELAAAQGADKDTLSAALNSAELKERLKAEVELAMARGVFGSPFFIVDGEPFWGSDRLPQLEKWLAEGPF